MRKRDELADPASCMSRAKDDEWTFVLLGRDKAAPVAIRAWAHERIKLGKNVASDTQIIEALECAKRMEREHLAVEIKKLRAIPADLQLMYSRCFDFSPMPVDKVGLRDLIERIARAERPGPNGQQPGVRMSPHATMGAEMIDPEQRNRPPEDPCANCGKTYAEHGPGLLCGTGLGAQWFPKLLTDAIERGKLRPDEPPTS